MWRIGNEKCCRSPNTTQGTRWRESRRDRLTNAQWKSSRSEKQSKRGRGASRTRHDPRRGQRDRGCKVPGRPEKKAVGEWAKAVHLPAPLSRVCLPFSCPARLRLQTRAITLPYFTPTTLSFSTANRVDGDANMIYDNTETTRIPGTFLFDRAFQNSSFQGEPNRVWYALYDSRIGSA